MARMPRIASVFSWAPTQRSHLDPRSPASSLTKTSRGIAAELFARARMGDLTPLVEAYLLIDQPRQRLGHWTSVLAALDSSAAPPLAQVIAFYDPTTDQSLLNLRYDEL